MKRSSKTDTEKEIKKFFEKMENKSGKEVRKIKKLAMSHNIPLRELRKKFCKKCYFPLKGKTRINNKIKNITCENCGYASRWKIKN